MAISKKHKKNVCNKKNHTRRIRKRKYKRKRKNKRTFRKNRYINLRNKTLKQKGGVRRSEKEIKQDIKKQTSYQKKIRTKKSFFLTKELEEKRGTDKRRNFRKIKEKKAKEEKKIEGNIAKLEEELEAAENITKTNERRKREMYEANTKIYEANRKKAMKSQEIKRRTLARQKEKGTKEVGNPQAVIKSQEREEITKQQKREARKKREEREVRGGLFATLADQERADHFASRLTSKKKKTRKLDPSSNVDGASLLTSRTPSLSIKNKASEEQMKKTEDIRKALGLDVDEEGFFEKFEDDEKEKRKKKEEAEKQAGKQAEIQKKIKKGMRRMKPTKKTEKTTARTEDGKLPAGWTEDTDERTGRQYYTNSDRKSTWNRPPPTGAKNPPEPGAKKKTQSAPPAPRGAKKTPPAAPMAARKPLVLPPLVAKKTPPAAPAPRGAKKTPPAAPMAARKPLVLPPLVAKKTPPARIVSSIGETKKENVLRIEEKKPNDATKKRQVGDRIEAKCKGWTQYFDGKITKINNDGTFRVTFDDGEKKKGRRIPNKR